MYWPRILIGITTYDKKDYIFEECYNNARKLDYPSDKYDILVVDNTRDKGRYASKMKRQYGVTWCERVERGANSREGLTKSQNLIRKRFLEGDYEFLLMLESDLIPRPEQLKKLLLFLKGNNLPVVGSTYYIGTGETKVPCIFLNDFRMGGMAGTRPLGVQRDPVTGQNIAADMDEVHKFLANGGFQKVHGCGLGCTLIRRDLMERFPFWCDERFDNKHSDVYFYLDLERNQIPVYVDTGVVVPHYPIPWDTVEDR